MPVFAEVGSTGYKVMLLLHILTIVVAFAPAWLTPVLVRITAKGDRAGADALDVAIIRYSLPGLVLAGLFGFGLAGMSKIPGTDELQYKMSQPWLTSAILLWLVLIALWLFLVRPAVKHFGDGDTKARGLIMAGTGVSHLIFVVMLYLMIFKPGL